MICGTCSADVHPQPFRISVGCCVKCGTEIPGFKAHDAQYQCIACGHTDHARPVSKFIHRCTAVNCGARMPDPGEIVDETPAEPVAGETEPAAELSRPRNVRTSKLLPSNEPIDPVKQCRDRLAYVQERIAELRGFEKEERRLVRMLSVLDEDDLAAE